MNDKINKIINDINLDLPENEHIKREVEIIENQSRHLSSDKRFYGVKEFYDFHDLEILHNIRPPQYNPVMSLQTIDDLMDRDKQRQEDGFPRRIRLGKIMKPIQGGKEQIVIVPTTEEPKFYHDNSVTEDEEEEGGGTGGSGEGEEGEVIGEQEAEPQEGEGQGAGQGQGGEHEMGSEVFDLGRVLTEKFKLPNLKNKGKKKSFSKFTYDLTDKNRGFGQILDKKETIRKIIKTNIVLGNLGEADEVDTTNLMINPKDQIFKILSREKDYESQAIVFFVRDYSGSMQGAPTEAVVTQHLFIYSWLVYQYQNNVETRFILHDTEAKEVPDFHTYHNSQVAGGTNISPAYEMVLKIIEEENLATDYNIYIFHGTDGDDWESDGKKAKAALNNLMKYSNRIGITVARNNWGGASKTTVERYLENSNFLKEKRDLIRLDSFQAEGADENRIIEGIKKLVEE